MELKLIMQKYSRAALLNHLKSHLSIFYIFLQSFVAQLREI